MAFSSDLEIVATEGISVERSVELEVCLKICQGQNRETKKEPEEVASDEDCLISPSSESRLLACEVRSPETPKRQCDVDEEFQLQAEKVQRGVSETLEVEFPRGRDVDQIQRKKTKRKGSSYGRRRKKRSKTIKLSSLSERPTNNVEADAFGGPLLEEDERRKNLVLFLSDDEDDSEKVEATPNADLTSEFPESRIEEPLNISTNSIVSGKFAYPSRNDPEAVEVLVSDLEHLQDLVFVNDTVIDFYIKYLQSTEGWCPDLKNRLHFYNSFFYKKLHEAVQSQKNEKNNRKMQKLRKWTKGINVFEKSYLFVPIHDKLHWSLAIICLPGASSEALSPDSCCILHFDSMNNGHKSQNIFRMLRSYLMAEWEFQNEAGSIIKDAGCIKRKKLSVKDISARRAKVPLQENEFDCGLFLLHFIECFVKEATPTLRSTEVKSKFGRDWFVPQDASNKRETIRKTIENLLEIDCSGKPVTESSLEELNLFQG